MKTTEAQKVANKKYYEKHREQLKEKARDYYKAHPEVQKNYHKAHPEVQKKWVKAHPEARKKAIENWFDELIEIDIEELKYRRKKQQFVRRQKKQCALCGETDVKRLVFSHRDPATKNFELKDCGNYSWQEILDEIAKCDVICKTCCGSK